MNGLLKIGLMITGAYALHSMLNPAGAMPVDMPPVPEPTPAPLPTSSQPASASGYPAGTFPMGKGSRSTYVSRLQSRLGFTGKDVDGIFGPKTEAALKAQFGLTRIANSVDYERILSTPAAKTTPATPAPTTQPTATAETVKVGELNIVFNALFRKANLIPNTYQYQTFIDQSAILALLESRKDAYLITYAAYWKAYWKKMGYQFTGAARATRFLRADLENANSDLLKSVRMKNFIARLKRLNIA